MIYVYTNIQYEIIELYKILFTNAYIHKFPKAIQRATLEMLYKLCFIVLDCIPPNASIILKIFINLPFDCTSIACKQHNGEIGLYFFSSTIDIIILHPYMIIIITHIHVKLCVLKDIFMNELLKIKKWICLIYT